MKVQLLAFLCIVVSSAASSDFEFVEFNLQCTLDNTNEITNGTNLSYDFELLQVSLDLLLKNDLKNCYKNRNHFAQYSCKFDIGIELAKALGKFQQSAMNNNNELAIKIHDQIEGQCLKDRIQYVFDEEVTVHPRMAFGLIRKAFATFKCAIKAITNAVIDTNIFRVWVVVRDELQMILDKTRSCRSEVTMVDQIRCVYIELRKATNILLDFYKVVYETNREVYIRILNYVKFCLV